MSIFVEHSTATINDNYKHNYLNNKIIAIWIIFIKFGGKRNKNLSVILLFIKHHTNQNQFTLTFSSRHTYPKKKVILH